MFRLKPEDVEFMIDVAFYLFVAMLLIYLISTPGSHA